jgi:DNA recombination protein RmuC
LEFTHLANRIFEEKGEKLHRNNQAVLDVTLSPLREQLKDFHGKVEEVYDKEARERFSLQREIVQLKELNLQMSQDAINLTQALKGESKTQGNWGEVILEKVLEDSGLRKGREYDTQSSFFNTEGKRRNPDVIIHLPENKDVIIDAKVSLVDYERYCSAINDEERAQALKGHIQSLRNHIKGLSFKDYENLEGIRTLDFVFIFVPIESAFLLAVDHDTSMFRDAYEKNIIIVSPTTLLATLRTVESIWRYERQNRNAEKIAKQAGRLHDQFVLVIEALEDVGRSISKAQDAYETTFNRLSKGKGNLVKRVINLEKLGAKVKKKVPDSIRHAAQLDDVDALETGSLNVEYEDND